MKAEPDPIPRAVFLDAAVALLALFGLYLLLGQDTFFKADGQHLVRRLLERDSHYPHHKLYMPLLIGFSDLVAPLGLTAYRTSVVFSALGVAFGAGLCHVGFAALGATRVQARLMTALVGLCPALLQFATVVEFHGPFFAFAGICFLETAFLARRPGPVGAAFLGGFCAVAAGVHASGIVLPGLLLLWFLALRRPLGTWKRDLVTVAVAAVVNRALVPFVAAPEKANEFLDRGFGHPQGVTHLPGIVFEEWLWPFFPISVAAFVALRARDLRLQVLALAAGLAPYMYGALRLLVGDSEQGAYVLPVAVPAAWLTVRALGTRTVLALAVLAAALGVTRVFAHDTTAAAYRNYADGMRAATGGERAFLLLGDGMEVGACLVFLPETKTYLLDGPANLPAATLAASLPTFDRIVRENEDAGRRVYLTKEGRSYLENRQAHLTEGGTLLMEHIERKYHLVPVRAPGFAAWRLRAK